MAKKYFTDESLSTLIDQIKSGDAESLANAKSYTNTEVAKKANSSHTHDDRYYTESEVDTKISGVSSTISTHTGNATVHITSSERTNWNSAYSHSTSAHAPSNAEKNIIVGIQKNGTDLTVNSSTRKVNITVPTTAAEVGAATSTHNHDDEYDTKGASETALASAKEYTDTKTSGMATTTVVNNKISSHNTSTTAHSDIRDLISALSTKVNNFLDVDDTTTDQLSEVLTLINNNKGTLESLTTSKVNVSDIVDNLTTSSTSKVLSAKQGVAIKALIDALQEELDGKAAQTNLDTHVADTTKHITATERTNWNTAYTHSQSAHVTGVKGGSESTYRTGNVNITKGNIGLGNVDNTSDANKPVSTAQQEAIDEVLESAQSYTDTSLSDYYTKTEINNLELITTNDIDTICGTTIQMTNSDESEVTF